MGSIIHTLDLLELLANAREPQSLADLARLTRRPKSTLHRQLGILVRAGFVSADAAGQYSLTLKLWSLGTSVFSHLDVVSIARPHLERLMRETNEAAHLAILESPDTAIYVARVESRQPVGAKYQVGDRIPAHFSSSGRAILAFQEGLDVEQHVQTYVKSRGAGAAKRAIALLKETRRKGYSVAQGEVYRERGGIAAPVRNHTGQVIASCGIAFPTFRMTPALIERSVPIALSAAERISADLGFRPAATAAK